jgi:predicted transcriptional regulator
MIVRDIVSGLSLSVLAGRDYLDRIITGGYTSDLLSNVMGNAAQGNIWVTMQGHQNVVAVASLAGLAAVILAGGVEPDEDALIKAQSQEVVLLSTTLSSFEVVGRIYTMGIKGE